MQLFGLDRPDLQYAAKEACREMAHPKVSSLRKLKRMAKYLPGRPRLVWHFCMQEQPEVIDVYTDANWAGCKSTRKSTSGGCAMIGQHCIKTWCKTQSTVARSSAESELYGIVRGTSEGLGTAALMQDMGAEVKVRLHTDANAAKGIIERKGLSKVRHLDVDVLWIQEMLARKLAPLQKILGKMNPADLMTKGLAAHTIEEHLERMKIYIEEGRPESASKLHML